MTLRERPLTIGCLLPLEEITLIRIFNLPILDVIQLKVHGLSRPHRSSRKAKEKVTDLIGSCPKCDVSEDRMEAVPENRKFWLIGKRKTKLIAICIDCWAEMDFLGTFYFFAHVCPLIR